MPIRSSKMTIVSFGVFLILIFLIGYKCRHYVRAVAWHCFHGDHTDVAGHHVKLPALWWKEKEADRYDTYHLRRAGYTAAFPESELAVRPALSGTVHETDQDALSATQSRIDAKNKSAVFGNELSLVVIKSKTMKFYCEKSDVKFQGVILRSGLYCIAAKVPYVFSFDGSANREVEAEAILSSME